MKTDYLSYHSGRSGTRYNYGPIGRDTLDDLGDNLRKEIIAVQMEIDRLRWELSRKRWFVCRARGLLLLVKLLKLVRR